MSAPILEQEYRKVRARQIESAQFTHQRSWGRGAAKAALDVARDELALKAAEDAGSIRFDWSEYAEGWEDALDQDFESDRQREDYEDKLRRGIYVVERCLAEVPGSEPLVHDDDWQVVASLHGIDHEPGDEYTREVERELAAEAGVI